jgi:hypothetical protein
MFTKDDIIYAYTRRQTIADGVLVDVTETAREAGLTVPVAVTADVWSECVALPPGIPGDQDTAGRLWDVLWMLRHAVARGEPDASELRYELSVRVGPNEGPALVELKAVCGPDDDGRPCLTVMFPDED